MGIGIGGIVLYLMLLCYYMSVEYSKIKTFLKNASIEIKIAIGLFLVLVVFVIVLTVVFLNHNTEPQSVDITNFKEMSGAPDAYKKGAQDLIKMLIDTNERIPNDALYQAVIREGSYSEEIKNNIATAHFLIDIEELRYSFEVTMSWLKGQTKKEDLYIKIQCPYYTDVIYTDTQCIAETPEAQVERYLPHNYVLPNGHKVHIDKSKFGGEFKLLVNVDACKDQELTKEVIDYAEKWLESIYLNPDNYKMEPYDTCLTSFWDGSRRWSYYGGKIAGENSDNVL